MHKIIIMPDGFAEGIHATIHLNNGYVGIEILKPTRQVVKLPIEDCSVKEERFRWGSEYTYTVKAGGGVFEETTNQFVDIVKRHLERARGPQWKPEED